MVAERARHFIVKCDTYESPTHYKTLEQAKKLVWSFHADAVAGKGTCANDHWVVERAWRDGRWVDVLVHEVGQEPPSDG